VIVAISAADFNAGHLQSLPVDKRDPTINRLAAVLAASGMSPLAGCTPESLAREVIANAAKWDFLSLIPETR
jgi:hypothetical protein